MPIRSLVSCIVFLGCVAPTSEIRNEDEASPALERALRVHLRTDRGLYVVAELGGGAQIRADRSGAGPWETFDLVDLDGGALEGGDEVALGTHDGAHFVKALGGGGGEVTADATAIGPWERFTLERTGGGEARSGDAIGLRASSGHYLVAEQGGGSDVRANRTARGPWETFVLEIEAERVDPAPGVSPRDVTLVPPPLTGPLLATITGYEMNDECPYDDHGKCELPLYTPYDRDDRRFWDNLVEELVHSRVHVTLAHGRGCYDATSGTSGNGNMCPRLLSRLVDAIDRAGVRDVVRLGMFDDTGAYQGTRTAVDGLDPSARFDLADRTSWRFFWDHNIRIWFDTVPRDLWYRIDGRPIVAFWTLSSYFFQNQRNHASALLRDLRAKFQERYGETPYFIVDKTWIDEDPTITTREADGVNAWFDPLVAAYTYTRWNGTSFGATVPSFRDPNNFPGCGRACRELGRNDGRTLRDAFAAGASSRVILLEGWTNVAESAGFYRSDAWRYPNQYVNVVREAADPYTESLRFEAEAADRYDDRSGGNSGGAYRGGDLDIGVLPGSGWFVGWTDAGEWLEFQEVQLAAGNYRFTVRAATPIDGTRVRLEIDGASIGTVQVPSTGSWDAYTLVHLGSRRVAAGRHTLRLVMDTGGTNVDWFFSRKD